MASGAHVDVSELEREYKRIEKRVGDFSPITPIIGEILVGYVNDEWDSAGRGRWPQLAPSTVAHRRGTSTEILKDTGRAAGSVRAESDATSAAAVTDTDYMKFHVSDEARTRIPLRNPFDVLDVAWPEISTLVGDYITEQGR